MELFREGAVVVTRERAWLGRSIVNPQAFDSCFVEADTEHAQQLGNILFANLCVAAALYFFVPIQMGLADPKFYLGVGLFGLLAVVVLDDIRRSNALTSYRLVLRRGEATEIAFVTTDAAFAARLERAMKSAIANR